MSDKYLVDEARRMGVCRICHEPIASGGGFPRGWQYDFGEMMFPGPAVTLNFGEEFAHTECLRSAGDRTYEDFSNARTYRPTEPNT